MGKTRHNFKQHYADDYDHYDHDYNKQKRNDLERKKQRTNKHKPWFENIEDDFSEEIKSTQSKNY